MVGQPAQSFCDGLAGQRVTIDASCSPAILTHLLPASHPGLTNGLRLACNLRSERSGAVVPPPARWEKDRAGGGRTPGSITFVEVLSRIGLTLL